MSYNFIIGPTDTDSVSFCKADMTPFSKEERDSLLKELNSISPEMMIWEDDGYYKTCVALKAKNYILEDEKGKIKFKGSSLVDKKREPALREMSEKIIECLLSDNPTQTVNVYHSYIKEAFNVTDIKRWATKKTITKSVLNCATDPEARLNERKVYDAVKRISGLQEGDKVYLYPVILGEEIIPGGFSEKTGKPLKDKIKIVTGLKLIEDWNGDEDKEKLMERVVDSIQIFNNVLDSSTFIDYTKSKNKELLKNLLTNG